MDNLRRLGNNISITIPRDNEGFLGRECPALKCESYFKIQPGTGLKGANLPCHCPYCGHTDSTNKFFTKAQVEYMKSVALNQLTGALIKDLKTLEFNHPPQGAFGFGVSMRFEGTPTPVRGYKEKQLETIVVCDKCTLRYAIYGVFGFCPDCRVHNSLQIFGKNIELIQKALAIAEIQEAAVAQHFVENALEDCVSAFDGFGREICRVGSALSSTPEKVADIRFQNIVSARQQVLQRFGFDFAANVSEVVWEAVSRSFQKRHLLAHTMGVIDEDYLRLAHDPGAVVGRRIGITAKEVRSLATDLQSLGEYLFSALNRAGAGS